MRTVVAALIATVSAASAAGDARAAQRYADPASSDTLGTCTQLAPCRLDWAIKGAAADDEIVVLPGDHSISPVSSSIALHVHGVAGEPRPRVLGDGGATTLALKGSGSTISHLLVSATVTNQDALELQGGTAEDLVLVSRTGDGAKLVGATAGTVLRDSVARSVEAGRALVLKDGNNGSGPLDVRNVTAYADGPDATSIESQMTHVVPTLRNVVARGTALDLEATVSGSSLSVAFSNFRPSFSLGYVAGPGNDDREPLFADPAGGDYHPLDGSPTIDAGASDALLGASDPDGNARVLGAAPDAGAFEWPTTAPVAPGPTPPEDTATVPLPPADPAPTGDPAPTATPTPTASSPTAAAIELPVDLAPATPAGDAPPAAEPEVPAGPAPIETAQPEAGKSVALAPAAGVVRVREPGTGRFTDLRESDAVPMGSTIDVRQGAVRLVSVRDGDGTLQAGIFSKGMFRVGQAGPRNAPMTVVTLVGGDFSRCPRTKARAGHVARAAARKRRTPVVRELWGRDEGGRFRTDGRYAAGTLRGTSWVTQDRCDGTLTRVFQDAVSVYDRRAKRRVLVRAGNSYLAKAPR